MWRNMHIYYVEKSNEHYKFKIIPVLLPILVSFINILCVRLNDHGMCIRKVDIIITHNVYDDISWLINLSFMFALDHLNIIQTFNYSYWLSYTTWNVIFILSFTTCNKFQNKKKTINLLIEFVNINKLQF